jgi:hypothetical protein
MSVSPPRNLERFPNIKSVAPNFTVGVDRKDSFKPNIGQPLPVSKPISTPVSTEPSTQQQVPRLEDFVSEAQKLGQDALRSQRDILREDIEDISSNVVRKIFGQNVGTRSGVGLEIQNRAIKEQGERLEPIAASIAADIGSQALSQQFQARQQEGIQQFQAGQQERNFQENRLNNLFNAVSSGRIKGEAGSNILRDFGITDPPSQFLTEPQFAIETFAASKGITVQEALDTRRITGIDFIKDVIEHPERYSGRAEDPEKVRKQAIEIAQKSNPPPPKFLGTLVIATASYMQGHITKFQLMDFIKFRLRYQRYKPLADRIWLGYQLAFNWVGQLMLKNKRLSFQLTKYIVIPWHQYVKARIDEKRPSFYSTLINGIIQTVGLIMSIFSYKKAEQLKQKILSINMLYFYKKIIRNKERKS